LVEEQSMGASDSKSSATNVMSVKNTTNVSSTQNCYNSQFTEAKESSYTLSNINCGEGFKLANVEAKVQSNCEQNVDISVLVKNVLDQTASAESKTGLGLFAFAQASANNIISLSNEIQAQIYANCNNSQQTVIQSRTFSINGLNSDGVCDIGNIGVSAQMTCTNSAIVNLVTDNDLKQSAKAKATAGLDLGEILGILMLLFGGFFFVCLFGIVMKLVIGGGAKRSIGGGGNKGTPLSELAAKVAGLRAKVAARAARQAKEALKAQMTPPANAVAAATAALNALASPVTSPVQSPFSIPKASPTK
jgi:hypothetical protein